MTDFTFTVLGVPVPQGSMRGYVRGGHVAITSDNTKLRPWRDSVAWAAVEAMRAQGLTVFEGPMVVRCEFFLPRPKSTPKRITCPAKKPDLDKLLRSCLDAMAGIVYRDDAQVVTLTGWKRYAGSPGGALQPGAIVTISTAS